MPPHGRRAAVVVRFPEQGRLAQRERRCLTSTRSGVQIPHRPPLNSRGPERVFALAFLASRGGFDQKSPRNGSPASSGNPKAEFRNCPRQSESRISQCPRIFGRHKPAVAAIMLSIWRFLRNAAQGKRRCALSQPKGVPMLVSSFDMMRDAHEKGYAIPSPDFVDSNSARAFVQVAEELHQPLILSFAEVHLKHCRSKRPQPWAPTMRSRCRHPSPSTLTTAPASTSSNGPFAWDSPRS